MVRTLPVRVTLSCTLLLASLCALAAPKHKEPAPRFNATTTTGEKFTNDSIKGKVVLLEFWTTWCGFCADEAAFVDKIGHELAGKGLLLLAINVGESKKTVRKYLEQHPRTCKIVMMEDTNLAAMYQATVYPIYVVIDRDGNIAGTQRGAGGEDALRELIARTGLESADSDSNKPYHSPSAGGAALVSKGGRSLEQKGKHYSFRRYDCVSRATISRTAASARASISCLVWSCMGCGT